MKKKSRRRIEKHLGTLRWRLFEDATYEYLPEEEIRFLYKHIQSKNDLWRMEAAAVLGVQRYSEKTESLLYQCTFDPSEDVRSEAADSLSGGRKLETLDRLKELLRDESFSVRVDAVRSHFWVYEQLKGYTESTMKSYLEEIDESYHWEKNPEVQISYMTVRYYAGIKEEFDHMLERFKEAVIAGEADYWVVWAIIRKFWSLPNIWYGENLIKMKKTLQLSAGKSKYAEIEQEIQKLLAEEGELAIMVVDRENTYLSQMLEGITHMDTTPGIVIYSAGLQPGEEIDPRAIELLEEEYGFDLEDYQEPNLPTNRHVMDAIVPIGFTGAQERFPLNRILSLYEHYIPTGEESIEDLKRMVQEIKNCFYEQAIKS